MTTKNTSENSTKSSGIARESYIAGLVHNKYNDPKFDVKKHVPDITPAEVTFFDGQFKEMIKDYRSE